MLPAQCAQKLSTEMNVELVGGQEVFGRQADGVTSQPHAGDPRWMTENIGNPGTLRSLPMVKARHTHGNMPSGEADVYPLMVCNAHT
jgi:hypothetical protein